MSGLYDLINIMYYDALRNDNMSVNQLKNFAVIINERKYTHLPDLHDKIDHTLNSLVLSTSQLLSHLKEEFLTDAQKNLPILYFLLKTHEVE